MKKIFYLVFGIILLIIFYYLYNRFSDYKYFKSNEYIYTSRIIQSANETFFNNYLRYPKNEEELHKFIQDHEFLINEFPENKIPDRFLSFGTGDKYIKDSLFVLYSLSFNQKDDWPHLAYDLDTLTFLDFVLKKPDILIYGSFPPSDICDERNSKLILNENDEKIHDEQLEKQIYFQLRKARIDYFIDSGESSGELKIAYLEFNLQTDNKIELKIHCYNNFEDEFKILLINSIKKIMIGHKLKKVIFPLQIII